MTETPKEIAQGLLPGWQVVRSEKAGATHSHADAQTPNFATLRAVYDMRKAGVTEGFATASAAGEEAEFVIMAPPADESQIGEKVVVVFNGRAIAVQG